MYNIALIGGGVIGVPTALAIQKEFGAKAKVIIFADKLSPHTTGDVAAGLWTPYLLQKTPQDKVIKWSKDTQDYILNLWKRGEAKEAGISLQLNVTLSADDNYKLPEWVKITLGYSEIASDEIKKYSEKYNEKFTGGFSYVAFIWEATKFLPYLLEKFLEKGGEICEKNIQSFDELENYDLIVNCTGLGAKYLVPDTTMYPIRGQISRVRAPWQFHSLMFDTEHGHYVIPNQDCVILGGTHQVNDFNTDIYEDDKNCILEGCSKYVPPLEKAPVLKHQAGLRPGRDEVCLEIEGRKIGNKIMKIVHNYGHGGSGVTLSIGCAIEAAQLVKEALGFSGQSKL